ncbi:aminoglycoside phosphotransferase family protein [Kribbella sp. NBC_00359]|uniref:aminoglycoside phosphotransferase family protein n=1 Tax=Kribbella sp. NBC_00359 TaxID=2975966 RepID=UPI002E23BB9F
MTHTVEVTDEVLTKRYTSWSRDEPGREFAALTLLSQHAPSLAPIPLNRSQPDSPGPWVSMSVLPGQPLSGALTPAQLDALGDALTTLWSVDPHGLAPIDAPALVDRTRTALAPLRTGAGVIAGAATAAAVWLDSFAGFDMRDPVVGHGDPNLANYLWDGSRIRIVDFEDAGVGDRTVELANLVEHLSGRATDWGSVVRRFDVDPDRLREARCLWAAFWLTLIGPGGPSADRNPPGTAEAQGRRVLGLLRPGVGAP